MIPYANLFKRTTARELLRRKWRHLALIDLQELIGEIQRTSVVQHLSTKQWEQLDRMRNRAISLLKLERALYHEHHSD